MALCRAFRLAQTAKLAYTAPYSLHAPDRGVDFFSVKGIQVLVTRRASSLTIAFRGSDETRDWFRDFAFKRVRWHRLPGKWHDGFAGALDTVYPQILALLHMYSEHRVYLTGHSLGGALAGCLAARLADENWNDRVARVVTFGAPRFCSGAAAQWLSGVYGGRYQRVVAYGDRVAWLPPAVLGYAHVGCLVYLDPKGRAHYGAVAGARGVLALLWRRLRGHGLGDDHRMTRYLSLLQVCCQAGC